MSEREAEDARLYRLLDLWTEARRRVGWAGRAEALRLAFKAAIDAAGTGPQEE
jgi:hypothetical protein